MIPDANTMMMRDDSGTLIRVPRAEYEQRRSVWNGSYAELLFRFGGLATCGGGLGIMVSPPAALERCPRGWVFVNFDDPNLTLAHVENALAAARTGRGNWPEKVNYDNRR